MSTERISRWLDSELEPELAHLLESSAADEPSARQLRDFETRMALTLAVGAAGAVATSTLSQAKLGTGLAKLWTAWAKVTLAAKVSLAVGTVAVLGSAPVLIKHAETPARERPSQVAAKTKMPRQVRPTHSETVLVEAAAAVVIEQTPAPTTAQNVSASPLAAPEVPMRMPAKPRKAQAPAATLAPAPVAPAEVTQPQLEREVALLKAMRGAVDANPCEVQRLGAQHRASFESPLLAPERDHLEKLAREHPLSEACPKLAD